MIARMGALFDPLVRMLLLAILLASLLPVTGEGRAIARLVSDSGVFLLFLLNGLRRRAGVTRDDYEQRTGLDWQALGTTLAEPITKGLVAFDDQTLRATDRGWRFLDTILAEVLP